MRRFVRVAMALASAAMVSPVVLAAQAKPVVAVLYFDNNSFGKDRADYDGIGKGMAELLINDLVANPNLRVVERERVQALMTEQNLIKTGAIDPQTAVRLGKMLGAQYMITGAFLSNGRGSFVLTARTVNVETSVIGNPTRIDSKGEDVLAMVAQLNAKMIAEMKIPALVTGAAGSPGATPAGQPAAAAPAAAAATDAKMAVAAKTETKAAPAAATKPAARKMDMKTAMLYSKALEEEDAGNRAKAVELYSQVLEKFPDYAPVKNKISKLSRA